MVTTRMASDCRRANAATRVGGDARSLQTARLQVVAGRLFGRPRRHLGRSTAAAAAACRPGRPPAPRSPPAGGRRRTSPTRCVPMTNSVKNSRRRGQTRPPRRPLGIAPAVPVSAHGQTPPEQQQGCGRGGGAERHRDPARRRCASGRRARRPCMASQLEVVARCPGDRAGWTAKKLISGQRAHRQRRSQEELDQQAEAQPGDRAQAGLHVAAAQPALGPGRPQHHQRHDGGAQAAQRRPAAVGHAPARRDRWPPGRRWPSWESAASRCPSRRPAAAARRRGAEGSG